MSVKANVRQQATLSQTLGDGGLLFFSGTARSFAGAASGNFCNGVRVLPEHANTVSAIAISPDGRYLASGSHDRLVRIWEVETNRSVATLRGTIKIGWRVWRLVRMVAI
uniref:WD40 repeat domain-containing protein n=1 Tax=Desertifilum tharense IPPAS B-1220 TaxID=1781255 RepID=A0ACD5GVB5_9CYAN